MTTVFHTKLDGTFIQLQSNLGKKKLHRTNQVPNVLGGSFSNRDNLRAPFQFRGEKQPQHLKRQFFRQNRPINFYPMLFNRSKETSWIFPALKSTSSFLPQYSVSQMRFKFSSQFQLLPQIRRLIMLRVESSIINIHRNITDSIIGRSLMYTRKSVGPRMEP